MKTPQYTYPMPPLNELWEMFFSGLTTADIASLEGVRESAVYNALGRSRGGEAYRAAKCQN